MGKLVKGGEPDIEVVARMVLVDWQRGRIPFFTPPPEEDEAPAPAPMMSSAAAASSSSSSTAAVPKEDSPTVEAIADESAAPTEAAEALGPVRQSLSELACSVAFDEEDRRGEPLPPEPETTEEKRERKEAEKEEKKPAFLKANRRKKRKASDQEAGQ